MSPMSQVQALAIALSVSWALFIVFVWSLGVKASMGRCPICHAIKNSRRKKS